MSAHHYNSNLNVEPWGFRIYTQEKTDGDNTVVNNDILRECVGVDETATCPHDYQSTMNQSTNFDLSAAPVIPANTVIGIGVEAPTAVTTNYYVNVVAGMLSYQRVE